MRDSASVTARMTPASVRCATVPRRSRMARTLGQESCRGGAGDPGVERGDALDKTDPFELGERATPGSAARRASRGSQADSGQAASCSCA